MIIKGTSCAGARRLFIHLTRVDTNERVQVRELRGVAAEDLREALLEMEAVGAGVQAKKIFYHASINTRAVERMTDDQRARAIERLEAELGLTGQPRAVVVHDKKDREHCHIVWSRIDLDRMAVISDAHNYRKHEQVARDLEREFGHERVQGAHIEREGRERPKRTPSHAEMLQADRTGLSPKEAKEQITELWRSADSGQAFANALEKNGWVLARGDRRDFVVIDPQGGTHSLARRIEGANTKDVRERLADIDPSRLPSVAEAKEMQQARHARHAGHAKEPFRGSPQGSAREMPPADPGRKRRIRKQTHAAKRAASGVIGGVAKVAEGLASTIESLLGGAPEPPKPSTPQEIAAAEQRARVADKDAQRDDRLHQETDDMTKARQELMRKLQREVTEETGRDLDPERERTRRG